MATSNSDGARVSERGRFKRWVLVRWCRDVEMDLDWLDAILIRARRGEASTLDMIHVADVLGGPR